MTSPKQFRCGRCKANCFEPCKDLVRGIRFPMDIYHQDRIETAEDFDNTVRRQETWESQTKLVAS